MKTITTYTYKYDLPDNLVKLIEFLKVKLDEVPKEYRDSALMDIEALSNWGDPCLEATISYRRPLNKEEVAKERKDQRESRKRSKEIEMAELKRLQAKYK